MKKGDMVRIYKKTIASEYIIDAYVNWVDPWKTDEKKGMHREFGYTPLSIKNGLWGVASELKMPLKFGVQKVEVVASCAN